MIHVEKGVVEISTHEKTELVTDVMFLFKTLDKEGWLTSFFETFQVIKNENGLFETQYEGKVNPIE